MKIKISNTYEDGHESESVEDVDEFDPTNLDHVNGDDDAHFYLSQFTGDGHGIGKPKLGYWGEVTVLESADSVLVGRVFEYD